MAKRFGGFTPDQQQTLLSKMGYTGPAQQDDMNKFMMSSPKAASMMGKYAEAAKARVSGGPTVGMAVGGYVAPADPLAQTTPDTTGAAPTPTYDPSTGLPTMPDTLKGVTEAPTELSYDPAEVVAGRPGGFFRRDKPSYIKLSDGTVFSTKAGSTGQEVEAVLKMAEDAVKERNLQIADWGDYDEKLGQYKSHQSDTAVQGLVDPMGSYKAAKSDLAQQKALLSQYTQQLAAMTPEDPQRAMMEKLIKDQGVKVTGAQEAVSRTQGTAESLGIPDTTELRATSLTDPSSLVTQSDVAKTTAEQTSAGKMAVGTGDAGVADTATQTMATAAPEVATPTVQDAATFTAEESAQSVTDAMSKLSAAKGVMNDDAQVEAQVGNLSDEAMAQAQVFDPNYIKPVEAGTLSVSPDELATPAGQTAQAITTEIAESDGLAKVVAEQGVVTPEQLPQPALIRDEDMAQAQAITDAGLAPDAVAVAARLESFNIDNGTLAEAMQGKVEALDTLQGQLSNLMKSFDDGTPAWAAGAMRAANAAMASRGLASSSMAGAAIMQAAMESAVPIAAADAQTFATMNLTNLNNRQQVALSNAAASQGLALANLSNEQQTALQNSANSFALQSQNLSNQQQVVIANAQIKAALQGQNLSNQQQSNIATAARFAEMADLNLNNRQQTALTNNANSLQIELSNLGNRQQAYVANANLAAALQGKQIDTTQQSAIFNASRYAESANITFSAEQQEQLHNSELMKTIGLAELSSAQATTLQNAATVAAMDTTNLNNRQQAAVENAKSFLQLDLTNLSNEQQTAVFKAQSNVQAILTDTAAVNAAAQFNAVSENQTNQFYDNLVTQVKQFNAEQTSLINRFNAGEANAISQFNTTQANLRDQFNAGNSLVIEQANAVWAQSIATTDNAAQNVANRDAALAATGMTETTYNNMLQQERDMLDYAWRTVDNALARESSLTIAEMQTQAQVDQAKGEGMGKLLNTALDFALKTWG